MFRGEFMENILDRINELSKKSKTVGLSEDEKNEQTKLRKIYLENFRSEFKNNLMNLKVIDELGNDVTPDKLKKEQNKKKN